MVKNVDQCFPKLLLGRSSEYGLFVSCVSGALCGKFESFIPQNIEVLSGSCVTIPCSFDIEDKYETNLDNTCKAVWKNDQGTVVFDSNSQQTIMNGELIGNLTKNDCTTTLNNMKPDYSNSYFFRVECNNELKISFVGQKLYISVNADPPSPTLTPSTLKVKEGDSVSLSCSAPAPCRSHPPTLTWTPGLGGSQETLQDNQDQTKVKISNVTFTASHLHHKKNISCTAVYNKQDGGTESSVNSPKHTTVSVNPSGPVPEGRNVSLTCSSTANPAVRNYTWYRADGGIYVAYSVMLFLMTGPEQHCGLCSGTLLLAVAVVSLSVNILFTVCMAFLWYVITRDYSCYERSAEELGCFKLLKKYLILIFILFLYGFFSHKGKQERM
uniref:Ig-like domain-containing protein n=1 Tax=Sander lucioperca TaxID=283035 RepID=A0A8C9Y5J5_SANLU